MAGDQPIFRGELSETSLPEVLSTINRHSMPGVVEANRDGIVKRIFIREGYILFATSSDRADSLGRFVIDRGLISPAAATELAKARDSGTSRLGEVLVERKFLPPAEVQDAIRKQIEGIVWSLFTWERGEVTFRIGQVDEPNLIRIDLPLRYAVLRGVEKVPDAKRLVARLGRKDTVYEPCHRTEDLIEIALDADEYKQLCLVDGKRTLYDLCTQGPRSPGDNGKMLYAFQVLQLIRQRAEDRSSGGIKIKFRTENDQG